MKIQQNVPFHCHGGLKLWVLRLVQQACFRYIFCKTRRKNTVFTIGGIGSTLPHNSHFSFFSLSLSLSLWKAEALFAYISLQRWSAWQIQVTAKKCRPSLLILVPGFPRKIWKDTLSNFCSLTAWERIFRSFKLGRKELESSKRIPVGRDEWENIALRMNE